MSFCIGHLQNNYFKLLILLCIQYVILEINILISVKSVCQYINQLFDQYSKQQQKQICIVLIKYQPYQLGMQRQSESCASFLSKTNRQFYIKRKKSPDEIGSYKIGKVLKTLIKKNNQYRNTSHKHEGALTQKRQSICTNNNKTNDRFFQIIQAKKLLESNLKKHTKGYNQLYKSFQKCLSCQSLQQMQFYQLDFYEKFNQILTHQLSKIRNSQNSTQNETRNRLNKQNALILQNLKLQKQNTLLRKKINFSIGQTQQIIKDQLFIDELNKNRTSRCYGMIKEKEKNGDYSQFIANFIILERKLQVKTQQNQIMKRQIQALKQQVFLIKQQKKSLIQRISQLKIKSQNLCSQIINLQFKNRKIGMSDDRKQAIMLMQYQQIQSYRYQLSDLKKLYFNLNKKYKNLIIKFKKSACNNAEKVGNMYHKQLQMFPQQLEAFQQVRGKIHPSNKIHLNSSKEKKIQKCLIYQQFFTAKQTFNNTQGIKKSYTMENRYYYPTFYALIMEDISFFGIDSNNFEHHNSVIKLNFIGTLRAIMDSKFNQFVLNRSNFNVSSFPAFVLAWLNNFQLNEVKKIQKINSNSISTRQTVCTFYVNLMSQKLNYSWQAITFRQFLLQTFCNDQLYFYLNLRYYLVGGDMCKDLSYCFEEIYYLDFYRCMSALNKIFKQNNLQAKKLYEQFLKGATVYIKKKVYVDLHYVLRIMLEYYQHLKQKQIQKIIKTTQMVLQGRRIGITLADFQKIFDYNLKQLSSTRIIELYRKCYCIGNGTVNIDIIITVLSQQNVFLLLVDTIMVNSPISIDVIQQKQQENYVITPNMNWLYQNQKKFRFLYNSQLARQVNRLGVEEYSKNAKNSYELNSKSVYGRLELCFDVCMMFSKKFYYSGLVGNQQLQQVVSLMTDFLGNLSKLTLRRDQIREMMTDIKYKEAGKKIVRLYHKKRAEMTRSILYLYPTDIIKDEPNFKTQILRAEFMQLIEQSKVKKKVISRNTIQQNIQY